MKAKNLSLAVLAAAAVAGAAADETPAAADAVEEEEAPAGPYTAPAFTGKANLLETFQDDAWSTRWIAAKDGKYACELACSGPLGLPPLLAALLSCTAAVGCTLAPAASPRS
jgi:hypothetical protein